LLCAIRGSNDPLRMRTSLVLDLRPYRARRGGATVGCLGLRRRKACCGEGREGPADADRPGNSAARLTVAQFRTVPQPARRRKALSGPHPGKALTQERRTRGFSLEEGGGTEAGTYDSLVPRRICHGPPSRLRRRGPGSAPGHRDLRPTLRYVRTPPGEVAPGDRKKLRGRCVGVLIVQIRCYGLETIYPSAPVGAAAPFSWITPVELDRIS